uniref:Uncharacterized protein n=1 Tax=Coccidioides posadasii RMSCC 3488 TaxID=454284 RepID=A0A0J6FKS9_COCPO|nr:hypothetical protein CPAG_05764 [Coccidioides posadasii RMSCC 3488]
MRYENWDVLLFAEGSRVPIQEFRTQCFVTKDRAMNLQDLGAKFYMAEFLESPYLQTQAFINPSLFFPQNNNSLQGGPGQVPVLTTFIPSLPQDNPFRVSIHSWERPRPTRVLEGVMQPDDSVMYEVRIFIDGFCVSWRELDKNGDQDCIRFPPFHEEILRHTHWDAGEMYGRIRVVVAEGLTRPHRSPPFERVKDIIVFSFQHAPLNVLEHSNIAWPNPGMWLQGPRAFLPYSVGGEKAYVKDDDAHSHSPSRQDTRPTIGNIGPGQANLPYRLQGTAAVPWQHNLWPEGDLGWVVPTPPIVDPFVDPYRNCSNNRSTLDDVSMPDYVASTTSSSRAISSNMSFSRNQEPSAPAPIDDEQYNQLIEALSPKKVVSGGTCAPANTPVSTAPKKTKPSATAETRVKATRSGPLQEISQPGSRVSSASSVVSDASSGGKLPGSLLSPSPNAFGKEKGLSPASSRDGSVSRGTHLKPTLPVTSSIDSKRKRSPKTDRKSIDSTSSLSPTPSKKISRRKEKETLEKENSSDLSATRATRLSISDVE